MATSDSQLPEKSPKKKFAFRISPHHQRVFLITTASAILIVAGAYYRRDSEGRVAFLVVLPTYCATLLAFGFGKCANILLERTSVNAGAKATVSVGGQLATWVIVFASLVYTLAVLYKPVSPPSHKPLAPPLYRPATPRPLPSYEELVTDFSRALGIVPLSGNSRAAFIETWDGVDRAPEEQYFLRDSAEDTGKKVLMGSARRLIRESPLLPPYERDDSIELRFLALINECENLVDAIDHINDSNVSLLLLHAAFASSITALHISIFAPDYIDEDSKARLIDRLRELRRELRAREDADSLVRYDSLVSTLVTYDTSRLKGKNPRLYSFDECTALLNKKWKSLLCSEQSGKLRLHLQRLDDFVALFREAHKYHPREEPSALVERASGRDYALATSLLDDSIDFIREFRTFEHERTADIKLEFWIDTIIADFLQIQQDCSFSLPRNSGHLMEMARAKAQASRNLIADLEEAEELSPDYVYASMKLHVLLAKRMKANTEGDVSTLKLVVEHGLSCAEKLLESPDDSRLLYTPVRTSRREEYPNLLEVKENKSQLMVLIDEIDSGEHNVAAK